MKVNLIIENNRISGYIKYPLKKDLTIWELEEPIPKDLCNGEYGISNGKIVKLGLTPEKIEQMEKDRLIALRSRREQLLKAFDIWEKAVLRGREIDSTEIMKWYQDIKDLKEEAIMNKENIPERIKYYL